mmetsp:Transcript_66685/g.145406  ORF Transcript_66685/g.145406 Transcript_66685/m.145406 type:complete len:266 (-) Transcript_66685:55-852(-)
MATITFPFVTALCVVLCSGTTATLGSRLLRGAGRSPSEAAAKTLSTLDTDHDGKVGMGEVRAFASGQGLDPASVMQEFASLDRNGDWSLDASELSNALGSADTKARNATVNVKVDAPQPNVEAKVEAKVEAPVLMSLDDSQNSQSAAKSSAKSLALSMVEDLALSDKEELGAGILEERVAELEENAETLARSSSQRAMDAASKAAAAKAAELLKTLNELEANATAAEVEAAELRTRMKAEATEANERMGIASSGLIEQHTSEESR